MAQLIKRYDVESHGGLLLPFPTAAPVPARPRLLHLSRDRDIGATRSRRGCCEVIQQHRLLVLGRRLDITDTRVVSVCLGLGLGLSLGLGLGLGLRSQPHSCKRMFQTLKLVALSLKLVHRYVLDVTDKAAAGHATSRHADLLPKDINQKSDSVA